jgi:hypothetical protein
MIFCFGIKIKLKMYILSFKRVKNINNDKDKKMLFHNDLNYAKEIFLKTSMSSEIISFLR